MPRVDFDQPGSLNGNGYRHPYNKSPDKFKKPNGKRGKPNPKSHCAVCGIVWTDHALLTNRPDTGNISVDRTRSHDEKLDLLAHEMQALRSDHTTADEKLESMGYEMVAQRGDLAQISQNLIALSEKLDQKFVAAQSQGQDIIYSNLNAKQKLLKKFSENDLSNTMFEELPPEILEMANRAGIGLEDLSEMALKIVELNNSEEAITKVFNYSLQMAQSISAENQNKLRHELEMKRAKLSHEAQVKTMELQTQVQIANERDIRISNNRWDNFNSISVQVNKSFATFVRWTAVGGGLFGLGYCALQAAKIYFAH